MRNCIYSYLESDRTTMCGKTLPQRFNIIAFESAKRFLCYENIFLYGQTIIQN